jgi:hypothetical protein
MMFSIVIHMYFIRTYSRNRNGYTIFHSTSEGYMFSRSRCETTRKLSSTNNYYIWFSK